MLNQTIITGHLGDDPKEFFSADEIPVTSFDLAFQAAKKRPAGSEWSHFRVCEVRSAFDL